MDNLDKKIGCLANEFADCQKVLAALGDENRQHLILEMMQMGQCKGVRVGEITMRTHLSRPAVSHHLQILKDAGILRVRREGTKNYYYFDPDGCAFSGLLQMLAHAKDILSALPNRSEII
ncbi:MAG: metalloregulator ArsR/SmtB family transcription factor [Eubacteriales bacterium]|nr:metalloregulator ArsR/SmtB family transcription factor [Eubacteriales bacterium]